MLGLWAWLATTAHAGCVDDPNPPASLVARGTVTQIVPHGDRELRYRVRLDEVWVGTVVSGEVFVAAHVPSSGCPPTDGYRPGQQVGLAGDLVDGHTLHASFCDASVVGDPSPAWQRSRVARSGHRDYAGAPPDVAAGVGVPLPVNPPVTHAVARVGAQDVAAGVHDDVIVLGVAGFDWARPADRVTLVPVLTTPLAVGTLTVRPGVRVVDGALADGVEGVPVPPDRVGDRWRDGNAAWPSARRAPSDAQEGALILRDGPQGEALLALSPSMETKIVPDDDGSGWVRVTDPRVHGRAWVADAGSYGVVGGVFGGIVSGEVPVDWLPAAKLRQHGVVVAVAAKTLDHRRPKQGRLVSCAPDGRAWVWLDMPWGPEVVDVGPGQLVDDPCRPS